MIRENNMKYPKVLVISHNCFSYSGSNGRTLANFFAGYPVDCLAQFYIYNELPTCDVCNNYYRITDKDVFRSLFKKRVGTFYSKPQKEENNLATVKSHTVKKTANKCLIRELIWSVFPWKKKSLLDWLSAYNPDLIVFQAGDAAFLYQFVGWLAEYFNIPYLIYNSESYYFKNFDYLKQKLKPGIDYLLFHRFFKKKVYSVISDAKISVYITSWLQNEYDKEFNAPSCCIMTSSHLCDVEQDNVRKEDIITYLGNMNVGRHETIIRLAQVLKNVSPVQKIHIYGNAPEEVLSLFNQYNNICYCGFVSYEKCVEIMQSSSLLIHVEGFSEFFVQDSKYAFSTKIADSLACGTCLFVLAPKELTVSQYLDSTGAACVVNTMEQAESELDRLLKEPELRNRYAKRARVIAQKNHSLAKNRKVFQNVLLNVFEKGV